MGFSRDEDRTLCLNLDKYSEKLMECYKRTFRELPPLGVHSPIDSQVHPELDVSEFLDEDRTALNQYLIGMLQLAVSIGRFDIHVVVMCLSSYRAIPR